MLLVLCDARLLPEFRSLDRERERPKTKEISNQDQKVNDKRPKIEAKAERERERERDQDRKTGGGGLPPAQDLALRFDSARRRFDSIQFEGRL